MADSADVRSLEQLEVFHERLCQFRSQLLKEIENLEVEFRRLTGWLEREAHDYWAEELVKSGRYLVECQDALVRCMSYVRSDERRPCTEEKKRLRRAQERKAICERQMQTVRAAAVRWEQERTKNHAKLQRCRDLAESDLVVAVNHLRGQMERLATYAGLRSAAVSSSPSGDPTRSTSESETSESDGEADQTRSPSE